MSSCQQINTCHASINTQKPFQSNEQSDGRHRKKAASVVQLTRLVDARLCGGTTAVKKKKKEVSVVAKRSEISSDLSCVFARVFRDSDSSTIAELVARAVEGGIGSNWRFSERGFDFIVGIRMS